MDYYDVKGIGWTSQYLAEEANKRYLRDEERERERNAELQARHANATAEALFEQMEAHRRTTELQRKQVRAAERIARESQKAEMRRILELREQGWAAQRDRDYQKQVLFLKESDENTRLETFLEMLFKQLEIHYPGGYPGDSGQWKDEHAKAVSLLYEHPATPQECQEQGEHTRRIKTLVISARTSREENGRAIMESLIAWECAFRKRLFQSFREQLSQAQFSDRVRMALVSMQKPFPTSCRFDVNKVEAAQIEQVVKALASTLAFELALKQCRSYEVCSDATGIMKPPLVQSLVGAFEETPLAEIKSAILQWMGEDGPAEIERWTQIAYEAARLAGFDVESATRDLFLKELLKQNGVISDSLVRRGDPIKEFTIRAAIATSRGGDDEQWELI